NDSMYMKFVDRKAWNGLTTVSNVGGGDYHLQHNSPAVGLKKTLYYSYDITGKQQYIGDSSAAGAYEYGEIPEDTTPSAPTINSVSPSSPRLLKTFEAMGTNLSNCKLYLNSVSLGTPTSA